MNYINPYCLYADLFTFMIFMNISANSDFQEASQVIEDCYSPFTDKGRHVLATEGKRKFYILPHAEKYNIHVTKFVSLSSCLLA